MNLNEGLVLSRLDITLPRPATSGRGQRLRLSCAGARSTPDDRLYGASHTAARRRCDPTGRRTNPVARLISLKAKPCQWHVPPTMGRKLKRMAANDQLEPEAAQGLLAQQVHSWPLPIELVGRGTKKGERS